ncbi:MAG: DUF4395 domain-containing protein [Campylobacterota bacterium]|nr:DUF4395 domain-containing protein [Campylobacterota bacterium]
MAAACPLNYKQLDSTLVRIGSFYVIVMLTAFLITSNVAVLYLLGIDALFRVYGQKQFSFIYQLASGTKHLLRLPTKMADAGAKRLAGQFALLFVLMLIVGHHLEVSLFIQVVAGIFLLCSLMELLFDFCVGCKVYYIVKYFFPGFHS